jgi:hypothetical protein
MPILPTPPWAMEEHPLPAPAEILVIGGDAPAAPSGVPGGGGASSPMTTDPAAETPQMGAEARDTGATDAEQPSAGSEAASLPGPDNASTPSTEGDGARPEPGAPAGHASHPLHRRADDPADPGAAPVGEALAQVLDPLWDDAFPTLAAIDAIRAAFAVDAPGPDEAARVEFAALLGLDPELAAEEAAFLDALRDAPAPDGDALLDEWLSAARAAEFGVAPAPAADWPFP